MIQQLRFNGVLNLDDNQEVVPFGSHVMANNIRFFGNPGFMTAQNIPGTIQVPNSDLPSGTNITIGGFYDSVRRRVIFFNYNSNGFNGIYSYDFESSSITKIFLCFVDSADDILNFSPNFPVHSAAIVYRLTDGDLLYWTDETNRPRYININTVSTLAPFTEDMINAGKDAPAKPTIVSYQNDANVNVNNLRKQLFRFIYRWGYANGEKSTWSPISIVPLPVDGYTPDTQNSSTLNNNILVQMFAGGNDSTSIELGVQVNNGTTWSDFLLVDTFNMLQYGINPFDEFDYNFFNDGAYPTIDIKETNLYYSFLPDKANTLETLNGNVIIYGGVTDGYPPMQRSDVDVNITSGSTNPNIPSISFQYTDASSIVAFIGSTITVGATYHVQFNYVSGGVPNSSSVNYVTLGGDTASSIATAIAALLNGGNVQATPSSDTFRVTILGVSPSISDVIMTVSVTGSESAGASWLWSCNEQLALIYFDDRMKPVDIISFTTAAVDTTDFAVTTPNFSTNSSIAQVPFLAAQISHFPPTGATTFQWLRAAKAPKFLHWITNDYQTDASFIYFCIQNLDYTKTRINGYVPSYEFVQGDRIRVMAKYTGGINVPFSVQLDMEILGTVDRIMTTPASTGRFIKCAKPTTFPTVPYSANMFVQIYSPEFTLNADKQIYYEWGKEYPINEEDTINLTYSPGLGIFEANETITQAVSGATAIVYSVSSTVLVVYSVSGTFSPGLLITGGTSGATGVVTGVATGTPIRFHDGQIQSQTTLQPATFEWFDGDVYYKNRTFYLNVNDTAATVEFMMDANYSDFFPSAVNSNGRGWVLDPNANRIYRPTQARWGQSYIQDTDINQLNIFYPNDFDTYDLSKGAIRRFKSRDRIMRVFQERGVGEVGVFTKFIKDSGNTTILETSDTIITSDNIQYYLGEFGLGSQPCSLICASRQDYFCDPVRGYQLRVSGDGITEISELYKGQFYIRNLILQYNQSLTKANGFLSYLMGAYNYLDEEAVFVLPGGEPTVGVFRIGNHNERGSSQTWNLSFAGTPKEGDSVSLVITDGIHTITVAYTCVESDTTQTVSAALVALINASANFTSSAFTFVLNYGFKINCSVGSITVTTTIELIGVQNNYTFSFNEKRNAYSSFFDYHPEWIVSCQDLIVSFLDGQLYTHNSSTYCRFYGVQYDCSITVPFNQNLLEKKTWMAMTQVANDIWTCPEISTNVMSYGSTPQASRLVSANFRVLEGNNHASFLRDSNINWLNGSFLKGNIIVIKFLKQNASSLIYLNTVSVLSKDSPLTVAK